MYTTSDTIENMYLKKRGIPLVSEQDGVCSYHKNANLYLELFYLYYQLDARAEYDDFAGCLDAIQ